MKKTHFLLTLIIIACSSCTTMSFYDAVAYKETVSAKVEAANLMKKANRPFKELAEEREKVGLMLQKQLEYERHRPKNTETTQMWTLLLNPEKKLYGGFMKRWEQQDTLSNAFINEAIIQTSEAFDIILELESQKINKDEVSDFLISN